MHLEEEPGMVRDVPHREEQVVERRQETVRRRGGAVRGEELPPSSGVGEDLLGGPSEVESRERER